MPLVDLERRVCERIAAARARLIDELAEAVAIPTGQGHRPGLDAYGALLAARLEALGARIETRAGAAAPDWLRLPRARAAEPAPILIARGGGSGGGSGGSPRVLIAGHMDTVHDPAGAFQVLTIEPDGLIARGPGAVDMKGGIVIALAALHALQAEGVPLRWTFFLNADEETGSPGSMAVLQEISREHDVGIAVEPPLPGGALAVERMGSGQFKIEAFGRAAHVGRDFERGVSAVTALARAMLQAAALADPRAGAIVNIGPLQGGEAANIVPAYAACWGNIRFADAATAERLAAGLRALAREGDPPRVLVHQMINRPHKPLTPAVQTLASAARSAAADLGFDLPFASTGGVCDGNLMQAAGLPTLDTLGVRGGNLHRDDEFVELSSLVERGQLLAVLLARVAGGSLVA
jgi:glutamate carboxypeptidase